MTSTLPVLSHCLHAYCKMLSYLSSRDALMRPGRWLWHLMG